MMLSREATEALMTAASSRQGARVLASKPVLAELADKGLIGAGRGLTRTGTIERDRAVEAAITF